MSFLKNIEGSIGATNDVAYQHLEFYWGSELQLFRPNKSDVHSKIHNTDANTALVLVKEFVGIIQMDDLVTTDGFNQADFQEGFLITRETHILAGDVIILKNKNKRVRLKVEKSMDIGYTTDMFSKFSLSNMN